MYPYLVFLSSFLVWLGLDIATKAWVSSPDFSTLYIVGDFLRFQHAENPGIAFSIPVQQQFLVLLTIGIILALLYYGFDFFQVKKNFINQFLFGIIIAGAVGNLIERISAGAVTDFIAVHTFPVFNIADIGITVGLLLLFLRTQTLTNK